MATRESSLDLTAGVLAYADRGSGPVLVFVHGVFVDGLVWRKVVAQLEARFRCVVPTLPLGAHRVPMAADADLTPRGLARLIAEVLATLDLRDVTLIGNDTGGALCQLVVAHHPERIARVVLTNCDAFENFPPPVLRPLYAAAQVPGFVWLVAQLLRLPLVQRAFARSVARSTPEPAVLEGWFAPLRASAGVRRDLATVLASVSARATLAAVAALRALDGRALVAWGANDLFFPPRDGRRLAQVFRHGSLVEIANSRTFVPEDQPLTLARAIEEFVATTPAA